MRFKSKDGFVSLLIMLLILPAFSLFARQASPRKANYRLAARFAPQKIKKLLFDTTVQAHWLKHSDRFWYSYKTSEGKNFYIVDPGKGSKKLLFDNVKMAAMLTKITKDPYDAKHLPIDKIKFIKQDRVIFFEVKSSQDEEEKKKTKKIEKKGEKDKKDNKDKKEKAKSKKKKAKKKKVFFFEYHITSGKLTLLKDYKKPEKKPKWASISPDEKTIVFGRNYDLYYMDKNNYEKFLKDEKDKSIKETQLTSDGIKHYGYVGDGRDKTDKEKEKNKDKRKQAYVTWSRDSSRIAVIKEDERKVKDLWVIDSIADPRPTLETYKYPMAGDKDVGVSEMYVIDLKSKKKIKMDVKRFKDQSVRILRAPRLEKNRDDENKPSLWLSKSRKKLFFIRTSRDLHKIDICVADTDSGKVKILIEERLNTYVETRPLRLINNETEMIHWSERDGWAHFYLYNSQGKLKKQLTSGPFHCNRISGVDEGGRVLYFTANNKEKGEDPYYQHLYRVNLNGTGLKLLNRGKFNHSIRMCDSAKFFVNNYSRVNTTPKTALYNNTGKKILDLETADLSLLLAAGFKFPQPFKVKADDSITDIYGVIYKPFDFDKSKKYPLIAYVYPGPQTEAVSKSFGSRRRTNDALAQLGFIVIEVGNRGGHPARSKWYHNYGYGNLRDYGLADKKAAIEQLAARYPFIDIDRIGIFGHSGGGFMSTAALLVYPDFFKVAVSSSGNHENNVYNRWWSEKHHGIKEIINKKGEIEFLYDIEKNSQLAKNLKGKLLLTTGEIDNNVHPAGTVRMANALIKANKRFDMFLFPGERHGYRKTGNYWFWLRADYFARYLLGDFSQTVDMIEVNREIQQTGKKKRKK